MNHSRLNAALTHHIRAEYLEMPGLRLTVAEAARFWGLHSTTCETVFRELEQSGFLSWCDDGSYRLREHK
jgi:DNA-binding IclR family transcriptional regulator